MTEIAEIGMSYEGLVEAGRAAREQADNVQWTEGDLALQVEALSPDAQPRDPETGAFIEDQAKALRCYANDIGLPYGTMKNYRRTAEMWPVAQRCATAPWAAHNVLTAQEDRSELIRPGMTVREAEAIVRDRNRGAKGKPGWLELMGMAADKLTAAGKPLAKVEAEVEAKGRPLNKKMTEKAERYRGIAQDLADRFDALAQKGQ